MSRFALALLSLALLLFVLPACASTGGPAPEDEPGGGDPEVPAPDQDEVEIRTPEWIIPAGTEILWCFFGVWEIEDVGVVQVEVFDSPVSHHTLLKSVPADDPMPIDFMFDCTAPTGDMAAYAVLFEGYTPDFFDHDLGDDDGQEDDDEGTLWLDLPEGMAVKMVEGQRWMVDAHYINPTDEDIVTSVTFQLRTTPEDEVEQWVGAWTHHAQTLELPPGEITSRENTCGWEDEMSILSIGPHMHEWGYSYAVDLHRTDGAVERVYNVDEWDPEWRNDPIVEFFEPGEITVRPGDYFTTTCTWNNTTDYMLDYPEEMCSTFGMATPLETAFECYGGVSNQGG
ncbi:MAG: hypothetical protein GY898_15385 [Proteobacteria bacterium]|nr:hypothetical protein [Pseudomonadota bacterium]